MKHNLSIAVAAALVGASAFALAAQAAETEYKFTWCGLAKSTMLTAGPDLTIWTDDVGGMVTPDSGFKPFENAALRCMGYHRVMRVSDGPVRVPDDRPAGRHPDRRNDRRARYAAHLDVSWWHGEVARDQRRRHVPVHGDGEACR